MAKQKDFLKLKTTRRIAKKVKEYRRLLATLTKTKRAMEATHPNLKTKPARDAARQFARQTDLILDMLLLPHRILMFMEGYAKGLTVGLMEGFRAILRAPNHPLPEGGHPAGEERPALMSEAEKAGETTMANFFALEDLRGGGSVRPWLFAIAVYTWTAFECLAADLWEEALNNNAVPLAHKVMSSIPKDDPEDLGFSGQHLKVGLAAKYGFDLRHRLGTLLKSKFDFTSVDGILKAYEKAFGSRQRLAHLQASLRELEQVRNLVVHRGGVVDDKFLALTDIKAKRGAVFEITQAQVTGYVAAATLGATALLRMADDCNTNPRNH